MSGRTSLQRRELAEMDDFLSQEEKDDDEVGDISTSHAGPSTRRKRKRFSDIGLDEVFEGQDPEEKKAVRREYRSLQAEIDDRKANMANVTVEQLRLSLKQQSRLFQRVRDTSIASLDARLIMTTADTALGIARKMKIEGNAFDVDEFLIRGILGLDRGEIEDMSDDEDELDESHSANGAGRRRRPVRAGRLGDWEKVGWMAAGLYRRVPGIEFMSGPILTTHAKRKIIRQARQTQIEPETRPQDVNQTQQTQKPKDDTISIVLKITRILHKIDPDSKGVNFFRLVVNPDDYGQTVENCFYVSFLIRDGQAGIEVRPDGEIIIIAREPHDVDVDGDLAKNQAVIELDVATWKEAKRVFNITRSVIPHRVYEQAAPLARNTWYS